MKTIKFKENHEVRKGIIFLVFVLLCSLNLSAQTEFVIGNLKYTTTTDSTVSVGKNETPTGELVIPASVEYEGTQYSVTVIGWYAFSGCTGLTSIDIPNSVTSIENSAFQACTGLTSIDIPNSVRSIGISAFSGCTGLTAINVDEINTAYSSIDGVLFNKSQTELVQYPGGKQGAYTIPNSVTSIGGGAFSGCSGLTAINVDENNTAYSSIDGVLFNKSQTELVQYPGGKQGAYTIPNSVTIIEFAAFRDCTGMTSIDIPNSVTGIGWCAFSGCTGLTSIDIPNSVTSIGNYAFSGCTGLTSIDIPNSVTIIASDVFLNCSGLTSIDIPNSVTSIYSVAFKGCTGLTSVTIGNSVRSIGSGAFRDCTSLTSVTINSNAILSKTYFPSMNLQKIFGEQVKEYHIGDNVEKIGDYAFSLCSGLTSVTIGNSVDSIGISAFSGCTGLTSVTIPNSVTSIGGSAFYECSSLTKVIVNDIAAWCNISFGNDYGNPLTYAKHLYSNENTEITNLVIPDEVTSIKDYAFYYCSGLTSVTIPNSVTSIGSEAFDGCSGLTSVTIPNSVTSIGDYAFYKCSSLTSVTIPNSVTSIGERAFQNCSGLTSVNIPNSVTSIGDYAFSGCSGLTSITIPNSVTSIGIQAFSSCTGLTSVTIPNSVTSIGEAAFFLCTGLTSITIPNSVTSIGESAFYNCYGLTDIYCHIEEPLTIASDVFNNVHTNTCTLHVPIGSKVKYQAADVWKDFLNIVEDLPTGIVSIDHSQLTIDNDVWFTLSGVRLNGKPTIPGIYIVNGLKVVIK